jgi:hypothetical protein
MTQSIFTTESDFDLKKELSEIMENTEGNLNNANNEDQLFNFLKLPDLTKLDLYGILIFMIYNFFY